MTPSKELISLRKKIGIEILHRRIDKGWTLKFLSMKINLRENKLFSYEAGRTQIKIKTLYKISKCFGCKISDFFP